ncbi:phage late control D family protein [Paenibacillus harenae]|uniref:Phage protein D n=1 Tax=Paenibacillus harenae TaxID=306543 RepID=A0ABT9U5Q3_PAEHA|nr:contractile injection system protein, VgrG/Pvc8 family [Paenibacillus harenae]MDQ0114353.1 phage protein D [Paenibacillus harenae]
MTRRAEVAITYNGQDVSGSIAASLLDLSYTDNPSGQIDDLQISLQDRERKWQGPWNPVDGDTITASIRTIDWNGRNGIESLPLGTFEVDSVSLSGPPDVVQIKALALPSGTAVRREARSKGWEKVRLKAVAAEIAQRSKLKLMYEAEDNPLYDRLDQSNQSDLAFLVDLCIKEGIAVKAAAGNLVLFDESAYERREAVATLTREGGTVVSYGFEWSTSVAEYRACQLTYSDAAKGKEYKVLYTPPGAPVSGPILKVSENVGSEAEGLRIARNRLRDENKNFGRASLALVGNIRMAAGLTINLSGWGRYDGKYIIERATHSVGGSGYTTGIEIRRVLGW